MSKSLHPVVHVLFERLALGLLILFFVSVIIFTSVSMLPGSYATAVLGQAASPEAVQALEHQLGLDRSPVTRYFEWIAGAIQFDFGYSYAAGVSKARSVAQTIGPRLYNTMFLAATTAIISVPLALFLGLITALYRGSWLDRVLNGTALGAISTPEFFIAYLLIYVVVLRDAFAFTTLATILPTGLSNQIAAAFSFLPAFPILSNVTAGASLAERLWATTLPCLTLTFAVTSHMMRMTRAALINLMASPYVEMARLKGISPFRIVFSHVLPNAWAPISNVIAFNLAFLIVGVVVVEVVFVYPGVGQLMVDSVRSRDIPVVQACALIFGAAYVIFNLLADVVSIITNPRLLHPR